MRATLEPTQRWTPRPKLKCRLPLRSRMILSGSWNTEGSRLAIAQEIHSRSPSLNCVPSSSTSSEKVRPSPGAGVKKRRNSSVAGSSRVSRSRLSSSRSIGMLRKPFQRVRGQRGRGVEAATDDQPEVAQNLQVGSGLAVDPHLEQRVDNAGPRILADLDHVVEQIEAHLPVHRGDPCRCRGSARGVYRGMNRLAVNLPSSSAGCPASPASVRRARCWPDRRRSRCGRLRSSRRGRRGSPRRRTAPSA